jgi:hypothetical protein
MIATAKKVDHKTNTKAQAKPDAPVDLVEISLHEEPEDCELIEYDEIDEDEWKRL